MLQPPFMGSFCGVLTYYLIGPLLPFPLAWVVWARYGFSWPVPKLEAGGLYPTHHTQLLIVKFGLRAPSFTTTSRLTLDALE